jgi:hypothetical protein
LTIRSFLAWAAAGEIAAARTAAATTVGRIGRRMDKRVLEMIGRTGNDGKRFG